MNRVTYDTGALVAADHNDRRMWALHAGFLAKGATRRHDAIVTSNPTDIRKLTDAVRANITIDGSDGNRRDQPSIFLIGQSRC
jgi:hypothetical protein